MPNSLPRLSFRGPFRPVGISWYDLPKTSAASTACREIAPRGHFFAALRAPRPSRPRNDSINRSLGVSNRHFPNSSGTGNPSPTSALFSFGYLRDSKNKMPNSLPHLSFRGPFRPVGISWYDLPKTSAASTACREIAPRGHFFAALRAPRPSRPRNDSINRSLGVSNRHFPNSSGTGNPSLRSPNGC